MGIDFATILLFDNMSRFDACNTLIINVYYAKIELLTVNGGKSVNISFI
jgi:hypothetical protein